VGEGLGRIRFAIRDRDAKYSGPFDEVFQSEGVGIVITPIRAPRANAFAKPWVRTVRVEWLDWVLIFSRRHPERVVRIYAAHYNDARPHLGLRRRDPDMIRPPGQPTVRAFECAARWAGSSVSTNSPLELDCAFVCPSG
jgi:putative transposase